MAFHIGEERDCFSIKTQKVSIKRDFVSIKAQIVSIRRAFVSINLLRGVDEPPWATNVFCAKAKRQQQKFSVRKPIIISKVRFYIYLNDEKVRNRRIYVS